MAILTQIGVVLGVCLVGELVAQALLCAKVIKPHHIRQKGDFLLKNMAFFFIPAGVGILENFDQLKSNLLLFLAVCVLTTFITFFVSAMTVRAMMALQKKGGK